MSLDCQRGPFARVITAALASVFTAAMAAVACAQAQAEQADVFPPPEGTTAEILKFIDDLVEQEFPEDATEEEQTALQKKMLRSIALAAEQALAAKPASPEEEAQAYFFRLQALTFSRRLKEPGADEAFAKTVKVARQSKNSDVAAIGLKFFIENRLAEWKSLDESQRDETVEAVLEPLRAASFNGNQVNSIVTVADSLDQDDDLQRAAGMVSTAVKLIEDSKFPQREGAVEMLSRIYKRLSLPGQKLVLSGKLLGGGKLDWKQYEGKVVLIDFWATWCPGCVAEIPNVLRMYKSYHDQGFEVIGVNLDDDLHQADQFMQRRGIKWATLLNEDENGRNWGDELAITAIPRAILLDRDGKVVSMQAHGENLKRLLHDMLGAPKTAAN